MSLEFFQNVVSWYVVFIAMQLCYILDPFKLFLALEIKTAQEVAELKSLQGT